MRCALAATAVALAWPIPAAAGPGASGEVQASTKKGVKGRGRAGGPPPSKREDQPWLKRWKPENGMLEFGPHLGIIFPARDAELFEADLNLPRQGFRPLARAAPEFGLRLGYFPLKFFGLEVEGGYAPTTAMTSIGEDPRVHLWALRGHAMAQLGLWSVTPFILVGGGVLAVASDRVAVGDDADQAFHIGLGSKFYINRYVAARFDLRDVISPSRGVAAGATNTVELLFGLSITFGRDRDGDKKPEPEPVAKPPSDRDGDGFEDVEDACPDEPGVAPSGCPAPEDRDKDGFLDPEDKCPDEPGVAPDGCPDPDRDHDGILNEVDECPDDAETKNGFKDNDGCPDSVPDEVSRFSGTLEGVFFETNKTRIQRKSRQVLNDAVEVLKKYPSVRVEISGHTDSTGSRAHNIGLSRGRAKAVKKYLVERGVEDSRVETRGAGPDEPIDTNKSKPGRARNRRIEFHVLD